MPEQIEKFIGDLKEILSRLLSFLSPQQKRLLFIGLPVGGLLVYAAVFLFQGMNYGPLYTNLAPQDGAAIIRELEAVKIPYRISGGGSVLEVPRGVIYQTRMKLAGKGMPAGGVVGFEIFEKSPFGVSEFNQQVNYLRALQGELSRTISSLAAVQSNRVHLAIPSRSSFLGPEEKPSASVVVDLRPGYHLSPDQVQGIVNLVAGSVPKLSAEKVTVIDSSGRPLKDVVPALASTEAEKLNALKLKYEQEMERRVETMLDPVLGPGKVVVRANVQLSLQETQMTKEEFDPDNRVLRSQRQASDDAGLKSGVPGVQSNVPGGEAMKASDDARSKRSSEMATYEVGRTTSRINEPRGQIQKVSVALLVDGKYEKDKYVPRSAEEIELIKGVVKRAVGFDGERGDEIEVATVAFKVQPAAPSQPVAVPELKDVLTSPLYIGVAVGAVVLLGVLAFLLMRRKRPVLRTAEEQPAAPMAVAAAVAMQDVPEEITEAAQKFVLKTDPRKDQLTQIAKDYHDATVRIIRMWLQEDKSRNGHEADSAPERLN